jgi:predicted regulator of Ras-like GTPase activity (Roadblock/LC7/MglB family)
MFKDVLKEVVEGTEGGVAGLVMGFDGIPIDHYLRDDAALDVETIGAEYSNILKDIRKAAEMLDAGVAREVAIQAERMTTVIRLLNNEYFVAVAIRPEGNFGKARYLLRTHASKLLGALE